MVIQELGIHSGGGSNVCFADKKGVLLQAEVHLSGLISFKQLFCGAERVRGCGHILLIAQQAVSTGHAVVCIYEACDNSFTGRGQTRLRLEESVPVVQRGAGR